MTPTLVIGVGSPFERDRIGWDVIDALSADESLVEALGEGVEFLKLDRPGSRLVEVMSGAERVVLIDAVQGSVDGAVLRLKPEDLLENNCLVSSHGFGVAEALGLASAMRVLPENVEIFGIDSDAGIRLGKIRSALTRG